MKTPRYLISFDSTKLPIRQTDILIIGAGISGLRAAIEASYYGKVTIITKDVLSESNTAYAQGGIATHLKLSKRTNSHIHDTLQTGQGINDKKIVRLVIKKGIELVRELISWGVNFDRADGKFVLAQEGGHKYPRILHYGDNTGQEIIRVLGEKVRGIVNIEIMERMFAIDILTRSGACQAVLVYHNQTKKISIIQAKKVIIATGGCGQLYRESTNPAIATGDGLALAFRAGAVLQDLEFVQFHPTALYVAGATRALISEVVRGAGGILRDRTGKRFMPDYHPAAELAPRDIVARSIINQMRLTEDTNVYLDLTHLSRAKIKRQFPGLYKLCQTFGINIIRQYIPVRPSAHYMIGGVRIKPNGSTNIRNLFATGEVGSSSFHGANRLGSNSLLEGLVLGKLVGETVGQASVGTEFVPVRLKYQKRVGSTREINLQDVKNSLKSLMGRELGIERTGNRMREALSKIDFWAGYVLDKEFTEPTGWELQNILILTHLITQSALKRTESRGVHFRTDYPNTNDRRWKKHIKFRK